MDTWLQVNREDPFVALQGYLARPRLNMEVINLSVQFIYSAVGNIDDGFLRDIDCQAQPRVTTDVSRRGDICPFYLSDPNVVQVVGCRDQAPDLGGRYLGELTYTPPARHGIRTLVPYTSAPTRSHGDGIGNGSGSNQVKGPSSGVPSRTGRNKLNKNNPLKRNRDDNNSGSGNGGTGSVTGPDGAHDALICPYHMVECVQGLYCCVSGPLLNFGAQRLVYPKLNSSCGA